MMSSLPSLMEVLGPVANDLGARGSSVIMPTQEWKEEERTRREMLMGGLLYFETKMMKSPLKQRPRKSGCCILNCLAFMN